MEKIETTAAECDCTSEDSFKVKLICPGCEIYERCEECFKKNGYRCGECYNCWGEPDLNNKLVKCSQLQQKKTLSKDNIYVMYVTNEKGVTMEYQIDKTKTFKVLMAKIRYDLLKTYKRRSEIAGSADCDELKRKIKEIKEGKGKFKIRFFQSEKELFEVDKITKLGNGATITQHVKYDGGCN